MPFNKYGTNATFDDAVRERLRDVQTIASLEQNKLNGRIRTGFRAAPSSSTDIIQGDAEGDIVVDGTYVYTLITVSGALKWNRLTHSTGW